MSILLIIDTASFNIKVAYGNMPKNNQNVPQIKGTMITYKGENGLSSEYLINDKYYYGTIKSSQWTRSGNELRIVFEQTDEKVSEVIISRFSFRILFFTVFSIDYMNYRDAIHSQQEISISKKKEMIFPIDNQTNEIRISSDYIIQNGQVGKKIVLIKGCIILFIMTLLLAFLLIDFKISSIEKARFYKWTILLSVICAVIIVMSFFGTPLANPDEDGSSSAVEYYYDHWGLPDYNSEEAKASFCNYGSSRLNEKTIYYYIAGKIGSIVRPFWGNTAASRLFNILLFIFLLCIYITYGKNNKWLLIGIILTPQLWYIFSYTTANA